MDLIFSSGKKPIQAENNIVKKSMKTGKEKIIKIDDKGEKENATDITD